MTPAPKASGSKAGKVSPPAPKARSSTPKPRGDLERLELSPSRRKALAAAGLDTFQALAENLPRRYLDRTRLQSLSECAEGEEIVAEARVVSANLMHGRRDRLVVKVLDPAGKSADLVWFHSARWLAPRFKPGLRMIVTGRPTFFLGKPQIVHPEWEELSDAEEARGAIVPVYRLNQALRDAKVDHRLLQRLALEALNHHVPGEILPACMRSDDATPRALRLARIHRPDTLMQGQAFLLHEQAASWFPSLVRLRRRRLDLAGRGRPFPPSERLAPAVLSKLPFQLHDSQREAVEHLARRMASGDQIQVLLQGDVGSGKTLVCLLAACGVLEAGAQVALLAPTEVLARQHLSSFRRWLSPEGVDVLYLAAGQSREERNHALLRLAHGGPCVVVGTHALLSDDVVFRDLALVLYDEQHRFGVGQRRQLASKGEHPHVVAASATPIPRSLLLGAHGDVEVLEVRGMPSGRQPIRSRVVVPAKVADMVSWLREQIDRGEKLFWVVPRIDESEEGAASVDAAAERLEDALGAERVGRLTGRMDGPEQNAAIGALRDGAIRALVSTTVVEVGVDVPDANLIAIEHAEMFGLAQLHQLRGRVGRGGGAAWCFLLPASEDKVERLRRFAETLDGFQIAELDMEERGAGDLEGLDQSGGSLGRSGLLQEHVGLLERWRDRIDGVLRGEETLTAEEQARFAAWFADERLGEPVAG